MINQPAFFGVMAWCHHKIRNWYRLGTCSIMWQCTIPASWHETFSALLAFCEGNPRVTGGFPSLKESKQVWTNDWTNSRIAGDFRRHDAHCDVSVMMHACGSMIEWSDPNSMNAYLNIWMKSFISILKLILVIGGWGLFYELILTWTLLDFTDEKSTLIQMPSSNTPLSKLMFTQIHVAKWRH